MERKRQTPKHTFDDATYTQHIQETCERIEDALQQGKTFSYFHICCSCCSLSFINKKLSFGNHQQPLSYCPLVTIRINTHPFLPSTHQFFYLSLLVLLILKARLWPQATRRSQFFHRNIKLSTLDFTGSRHWAPFKFSQSTPLSKSPGTGFFGFLCLGKVIPKIIK